MLYNGMLRGFGFCGEVPALKDVEYGCEEFWQLLSAETVADRMENAGHKFSSTMHALASAIKKIQGIAEDGQGTRLYRGLGKLLTQLFTKSLLIFDHLEQSMANVFNHPFLIFTTVTHQVGWTFGRSLRAQALPRRHSCLRPAN